MKIKFFFGDKLISTAQEGEEITEHSTSIMPFCTSFLWTKFFVTSYSQIPQKWPKQRINIQGFLKVTDS
jgi:hypothetical protein